MVVVTRGCYIAYVINNRSKLISQGHYNGELWGLTASQSKDIFMTAGDDGVVRLWDINQKREIRRVNFDNRVRALDLSNNEELLIADEKAVIYLYDQDLTYYDKYTG